MFVYLLAFAVFCSLLPFCFVFLRLVFHHTEQIISSGVEWSGVWSFLRDNKASDWIKQRVVEIILFLKRNPTTLRPYDRTRERQKECVSKYPRRNKPDAAQWPRCRKHHNKCSKHPSVASTTTLCISPCRHRSISASPWPGTRESQFCQPSIVGTYRILNR